MSDGLIPPIEVEEMEHVGTFVVDGGRQSIEASDLSNKVVSSHVLVRCSCDTWAGEFTAPENDKHRDMMPVAKGEFALHQHEMYGYR